LALDYVCIILPCFIFGKLFRDGNILFKFIYFYQSKRTIPTAVSKIMHKQNFPKKNAENAVRHF
ncbi:MAG: hypothetical protein IJ305_01485, partial [Oscillospiraceae bacterium]|nr:hypothetical protein [Oscillospiraceae bacterium]